jgi:dTDP-4-dehydrorhamnose 3,5-epimerase
MKFHATAIAGVVVLETEPVADDRGSFVRTFCARDFEAQGLSPRLVQTNESFNRVRGTLRGMHYQATPSAEAKVVRCLRGALYDVALDVREGSPTFGRHVALELREGDGRALYLAEGLAHGFLTLEDGATVGYQMSEFYAPELARGIRYDDPFFAIRWPAPPRVISPRDLGYAPWPAPHPAERSA